MALTTEQDERLTLLLQDLEPCMKDLPGRSKQFVEDQIARHDTYGQSMFLSPKQLKWLEDLYKEHVGGELPDAEPVEDNNPERTARRDMRDEDPEDDGKHPPADIDDEIPF